MLDYDRLTGLLSHRQCLQDFQDLSFAHAILGVILLDIDRFQVFNIEHGIEAGHEKIKEVATAISRASLPNTRVFRFGGEEFVVLVYGYSMSDIVSCGFHFKEVANRAFSSSPKQKNMYLFPDRSCFELDSVPSISCGIAFHPSHGTNLETLIKKADTAMYCGGKNLHPGGVLAVARFSES